MLDLKVQNISLQRGDFSLRPLSFSLHSGELIAIKGPNGSGKTSILKVIQGRLKASSGTVEGRPELLGCLGLEPNLMGNWTLQENRLWLEKLSGRPCSADQLAPIRHLMEKRFDHLSLGWQRRAEMALLFSLKLNLYLLDEALSPLDTEGRLQIRTEIETLKFSGVSFITTSHRDEDFDSLATRTVNLG